MTNLQEIQNDPNLFLEWEIIDASIKAYKDLLKKAEQQKELAWPFIRQAEVHNKEAQELFDYINQLCLWHAYISDNGKVYYTTSKYLDVPSDIKIDKIPKEFLTEKTTVSLDKKAITKEIDNPEYQFKELGIALKERLSMKLE